MICPPPPAVGPDGEPARERSSPGERPGLGSAGGPHIKLIDFGLSVFCDGGARTTPDAAARRPPSTRHNPHEVGGEVTLCARPCRRRLYAAHRDGRHLVLRGARGEAGGRAVRAETWRRAAPKSPTA